MIIRLKCIFHIEEIVYNSKKLNEIQIVNPSLLELTKALHSILSVTRSGSTEVLVFGSAV